MTLRVGHPYRGYRILNGDGTPAVDTDGAELWVTRCGLEVTGNRTDGLPGNMHPVVKLGTLRRTADPTPGPSPSPGDVVIGPGGLFGPADGVLTPGGFAGGQGGGPGIAVGGEGRVIEEDLEVWSNRTCTRTPGPPLGPFPQGQHMGVPLRATDQGLSLFADGCVECGSECPTGCQPTEPPLRARVIIESNDCVCVMSQEFVIRREFMSRYAPETTIPQLCPGLPAQYTRFDFLPDSLPLWLFNYETFFPSLGTVILRIQAGVDGRPEGCWVNGFSGDIRPNCNRVRSGVVWSCDPFFFHADDLDVLIGDDPCGIICLGTVSVTIIPEP